MGKGGITAIALVATAFAAAAAAWTLFSVDIGDMDGVDWWGSGASR